MFHWPNRNMQDNLIILSQWFSRINQDNIYLNKNSNNNKFNKYKKKKLSK